jgi:hypothetical protein
LKVNVIQEFISSHNPQNEVIKCEWTPSINIIEKKMNPYKIKSKNDIYKKVITYEGPSHLVKSEPIVSKLVLQDINIACKFIED